MTDKLPNSSNISSRERERDEGKEKKHGNKREITKNGAQGRKEEKDGMVIWGEERS